KKARSGLGRMAHEIPRRREAGDYPAGRAIPTAGAPYPDEARHSAGDLLPLVRPIQPWWAGGLERSPAHDLIASPAFIVIKAADAFKDKTTAPNQLWQT